MKNPEKSGEILVSESVLRLCTEDSDDVAPIRVSVPGGLNRLNPKDITS